ncbi:hypothetical protein DFH11DRAFT_1595083 [Phellopilus nigrolimitatus]|nr:hypothetical protein DFH11DRAFT_1595083 [Phellopilus nigrolimitatus]
MSLRKSGLQKEVLSLYRRALRLIPTKPVHTQPKFSAFIRYTFHHNAHAVKPRDITAIEHLLRVGRRQVEQLENSAVKDCSVSNNMQDWIVRNPSRR